MARERVRHQQLELLNKRGTGKSVRGGLGHRRKRAQSGQGARGRGGRRSKVPHAVRPSVKPYQPQHVVLRIEDELGSLRRRNCFRALRAATLAVAWRGDMVAQGAGEFRIVHLSIQADHVHLLVEAANRQALSRGMQAFQISAAKHLNAALGWTVRRRGRVFSDRYHARPITNRKQARHALSYVLNNWRKHHADRGVSWRVDPFSSGYAFTGWRGVASTNGIVDLGWPRPSDDQLLVVWPPRCWLLRVGWERYGTIRYDEVPSSRPT